MMYMGSGVKKTNFYHGLTFRFLAAMSLVSITFSIWFLLLLDRNNNYRRWSPETRSTDVPSPSQLKSEIDILFEKRNQLVAKTCRKYFRYDADSTTVPIGGDSAAVTDPIRSSFYEYTFYDDANKFMFCTIPKIASTNIKEMLMALMKSAYSSSNNNSSTSQPKHIHRLVELSNRSEVKRRANYTKIMFVRHPLERLLSTWRDKFSRGWPSDPSLVNFGHMMVQKAPDIGRNEEQTGPPPNLHDFFRFLVEGGYKAPHDDPHWRAYVNICDPCRIKYDYIGKFENLDEELGYIMNKTVAKATKLPKPSNDSFAAAAALSTPMNKGEVGIASARGETLRARYVDGQQGLRELAERVADRYAVDFEMFGYR